MFASHHYGLWKIRVTYYGVPEVRRKHNITGLSWTLNNERNTIGWDKVLKKSRKIKVLKIEVVVYAIVDPHLDESTRPINHISPSHSESNTVLPLLFADLRFSREFPTFLCARGPVFREVDVWWSCPVGFLRNNLRQIRERHLYRDLFPGSCQNFHWIFWEISAKMFVVTLFKSISCENNFQND